MPARGSRKYGLDGEEILHLSRLEDSPLGIDQREALALENKTRLQFVGGQMVCHLTQHSNMLESSHPHQGVPADVAHRDIRHDRSGRPVHCRHRTRTGDDPRRHPDDRWLRPGLAARPAAGHLEWNTTGSRGWGQVDFIESGEHAGHCPGGDAPARPMP